jgi:hypothetical protein
MPSKLEKIQRIQAAMLESPSSEQLGLSRAMPYGAAATSLAILCAMTQVITRGSNAQIAIIGATVALPLWLVTATIYEFYLYLGPKSYAHYRSQPVQGMTRMLSYLAGTSLAASVGGLVHVLLPWALAAYVIACVVGFWFLHRFNISLAHWWSEQKPEEAQ